MIWGLTIFLGAFLLFQVQPIMGRFILPWFGGGPGVWTVCLLFFQSVLLAGYLYAHLLSRRLTPRFQAITHGVLLLLSLLFLPIVPNLEAWHSGGSENPTFHILGLLGLTIGGPYLLLSATSPLMQRWFSLERPGTSPYRLYALSNVGSLLALLGYPFLIEPYLALLLQGRTWSFLYLCFALLCLACAFRMRRTVEAPPEAGIHLVSGSPPRQKLLWLLYAACGSVMLLATTNQLCQEVASVPFLWVLPLALYLITFILCFDHPRWYSRRIFTPLLIVAITLASFLLFGGAPILLWRQIVGYSACLWIVCMVCHGELVKLKPEASELTSFYLAMSLGGALGACFVALVAPVIFNSYWEFELALLAVLLLFAVSNFRVFWNTYSPMGRRVLATLAILWFLTITSLFAAHAYNSFRYSLAMSRNFFGSITISERETSLGLNRSMRHGTILHGFQIMDPEWKNRHPISYYGPQTFAGFTLLSHRPEGDENNALHVGILGLGAGVLAAYAQPGDTFRFYEINPEVTTLAKQYFTYLEDSPAHIEIIEGDGRMMLEREWQESGSHQFDILLMDAFNSDSVPVHLLTEEAARLYFSHLKPDGKLVVHISNLLLDLTPVMRGLADRMGCNIGYTVQAHRKESAVLASQWALLTFDDDYLDRPGIREHLKPWPDRIELPIFWTDDYSSLLPLLIW
jgi:hypothetical protein